MQEHLIYFSGGVAPWTAMDFGHGVYVRKRWGIQWHLYVQGRVRNVGAFKESLRAAQDWLMSNG